MADEAAVMDAPISEVPTGSDPAETGAEVSEPEITETGAAGPEPADGTKPFSLITDGKNGGKVLSPEAKAWFDKLKASTDPNDQRMARALTKSLFDHERMTKALGENGLKEYQELREAIEKHGGLEAIQEQASNLQFFTDMDALFTASDPRFVEQMTANDELKGLFIQMSPSMMGKIAELNPEGHAAYIAQAVLGHMQANELPLALKEIAFYIKGGDTDNANAALNRVWEYIGKLNEMGKKPLAPEKKAAPAEDPARENTLQQREQDLTRREWDGEAANRLRSVESAEWARQVADRKLTQDQRDMVVTLYKAEFAKLTPADFDQKALRYLQAGQKDGYLRLHEQAAKDAVPKALRAALRFLGAKPGPKVGTTPGKPTPRPNAQPKPEQGFTRVAKKPNIMTDVNRSLTSPAMWGNNQAVLKDGRKVTWA